MITTNALRTRASVLASLCMLVAALGNAAYSPQPSQRHTEVLDAYARLPITFVENRGQTDPRVYYYAHGAHYGFFATRDEMILSFQERDHSVDPRECVANDGAPRRLALALRFLGRNPDVSVDVEQGMPGQTNYLLGDDAAGWRTALPGYQQVVYRDLWPGVDLMLRGNAGRLKFEFRVRPGAELADIRLAYAGIEGLALNDEGELLIETALGVLRDSSPVSYQTIGGERVPVDSRYVLTAAGEAGPEYGFAVGPYQPDHELIIDPALDYSTFLGGNGGETGNGIAVDAAGNAYVVGTTQSLEFPTTVGAFDRTPGDSVNGPDVFVSKLNSTGTALVYSTYLGGSQFDFGRAIAVDAAGNAYVTGKTQSANFPTTAGAFDRTANIPETPRPQTIDDAFVTKLNPSGSALVYSTYVGGTDNDEARAIAIDTAGNAYIAGETVSADYPTTATSFDTVRGGEYDVFLTKLNGTGSSLVYSTFLGGAVTEIANDVVVDSANNALVVGSTRSGDFPATVGSLDASHNGGFDAFVTKFNAAGTALVYSTFLGGANSDDGAALATDATGNAYVGGGTQSPEFPVTPGAFDTVFPASGGAGFVLKLNPAGSALVYSTFLRHGGPAAIVVDSVGSVWLTGTGSEEFPVTLDAFDLSFNGVSDAIVAKLDAQGSALLYATFLGGSRSDNGIGIARGAADDIYVTGITQSSGFPTTAGTLDRVFNGNTDIFWGDAFVLKFDAAAASPGWQGPTITALAMNPGEVQGGNAAVGTVTLSGAAPTGGSVVTLSDDSSVVNVPASVTVPAGATTATFNVSTSAVSPNATLATISATLGTVRTATLVVLAAPPLLSSVTLNPSSVVGGNPSTATVHLSAAQSGPTVISIDPQLPSTPVSHPASVTVPAGATSASFTIATTPVPSTVNVTISVRLQGADSPGPSALLLVAPATSTNAVLSSLSLSASSVVGGSFLTGTVTLSDVAPSGGAVVTLSDDSTAATTSSSVTVPAGATSETFILTSTVVFANTNVTLSATFNGVTRTVTLTVTPAPAGATLSALSVTPGSLVGGGSAIGTVTLSAAAPSGGAVVTLSDNLIVVDVPASVTVPAGSTSATFTIATTSVTTTTTATITATLAGTTRTATLTVNPPSGGTPGTPSLQSPSNGATPTQPVAFNWTNVTNAVSYEIQIDNSSTISAPFVANQTTTVSQASIGGLQAQRLWWRVRAQNAAGVFGAFSSTRSFTPQAAGGAAASLSALSVNPTSVTGGNSATGTVTLTSAAPTGGALVTLSDNSAAATVPASVTVPAGATSATFTITTSTVATATPVTITGSFGGATRTATLTVNPAGGTAVTLTVTATGRSGERITSAPAGINVAVGSTGSASFNSGTAITLSVTNGRDAIWSGACSSGGDKTRACTFTINGNASVTGNVQ